MIIERIVSFLRFESVFAKTAGGLIALCVFGIGVYLSHNEIDLSLSDLRFKWIVIALLIAFPLSSVLNSYRFILLGRYAGITYGFGKSLIISIYSSAANLLPIPGGMAIRAVNLKSEDNTYKDAVFVTGASALLAAIINLTIVASVLVVFYYTYASLLLFLISSVCCCIFCFQVKKRIFCSSIRALIFVEIASVFLDAINILLCFYSISAFLPIYDYLILTVSSLAGSAVSIVPAGLGIKEGVGALLAPLFNISPAIAFVALALNRLIFVVYLAIISAMIAFISMLRK